MENASRALLIAAGMIMGILVLSLGVYLAVVFSNYSATTQAQLDQRRMTAFNDKYMKYDGRTDLSIQDVITVRNYALENNINETNGSYDKQPGAGDYSALIDVYLAPSKVLAEQERDQDFIVTDENNKDTISLLQAEINARNAAGSGGDATMYTCEVHLNNTTSRVSKIYFYETP